MPDGLHQFPYVLYAAATKANEVVVPDLSGLENMVENMASCVVE